MITNERIAKCISSLRSHALTTARSNQKYHVPIVFTNNVDSDQETTHLDNKANSMNANADKRYVLIYNTDEYRFDGRWHTYRYSISNPEEAFGILKVDDFIIGDLASKINKKSFIGRIDRLVFQGLIKPFMLFVDHRFVNWDNIELIYDCDDIWLILRGTEYNYFALQNKEVNIVVMPFKCEYFGEESDWLFNLYYNALNEYMQKTSEIIDDNLYIHSPTMDTEYTYNGMPMNVGGWLFSQIKKYNLGILSDKRINKLRYIMIYKNIINSAGNIIDTISTRYNALDKDVFTDRELYESICHITSMSYYKQYPSISFNEDGLFDLDGEYEIKILSDDVLFNQVTTEDEDKLLYDLSGINNMLFRENYLVFEDGLFIPDYPIMGSINNITFYDNPDKHALSVNVLYYKYTDHVIRNSDKFMTSYMNEQARLYLETLYHTNYTKRVGLDALTIDEHRLIKNIDAITTFHEFGFSPQVDRIEQLTPDNDLIEILRRSGIDAHTQDPDKVIRSIDANYLDLEFAFVPKLTDYIIYINEYRNSAIELVTKAMEPLDFDFDKDELYEENINNAIETIVNYDPALLNPLYHTYIDSAVYYGQQINDSLMYSFMYEDRRGLKIPRKRYKDHETYFMVFLNGELYENYYKTIVYANFFFIPIEDDFEFTDSDRIEVLYLKNVNNNEIRFGMTNWLVNQFTENEQDPNFYNVSLFNPFIKAKELNIFAHYPEEILEYKSIITKASEDIAFNISYRDDKGNLCIRKDALNGIARDTTDIKNAFVATSKRKFVYQRLYVEQKSYRILLDKRFRYCDNQKQYLLFVNGRRMKEDSFLVTIPKHTRPFNAMYLYTARFVGPDDRVELFYLPYEMTDLNIDNDYKCQLKANGYFEYDRTDIDVPLSRDLYLFFINGKKIPYTDIIDIDSNTVRVTVNTNTLKYPAVTAINTDSIEQVTAYLHDKYRLSKYDSLVNFIKTHSANAYEELDRLFGRYTHMTDGEDDKVWANVAKIAILNEIVRDFWVTSGYDYQDKPFIYDYETDELYERSENGSLILPALDANRSINIPKNEVSLLYFYTDPTNLLFELGNHVENLKFIWEYSQRLNQQWRIISQTINGIDIPVNDREYTCTETITDGSKDFRFEANTGQQIISQNVQLKFVNGIYWGLIDEDKLEYYELASKVQFINEAIAVLPRNGIIPSEDEQSITIIDTGYGSDFYENNTIIGDIDIIDSITIANEYTNNLTTNMDSDGYHYYNEDDLSTIINSLDKHLVGSSNIKLDDYIIGNNNYFVFACPTRLAYTDYNEVAEFFFPDLQSEEIRSHCRNDKATPVYTNGTFDYTNHLLMKLNTMEMEYMGECWFTNTYGYSEPYSVWKTNGFFTRLFENYGLDIHIKLGSSEEDSAVIFNNNIEQASDVNFVNDQIISSNNTEGAENMSTETRGTAGVASTLPSSNAASIKKVGTGKTSNTKESVEATDNKTGLVEFGSDSDPERVKELLSQGIFLI